MRSTPCGPHDSGIAVTTKKSYISSGTVCIAAGVSNGVHIERVRLACHWLHHSAGGVRHKWCGDTTLLCRKAENT